MRRVILGIILGLCGVIASAAPTFSDRSFGGDALNPGDDNIVVQVIQVRGDSAQDATIEFVHVRNAGSATSAHVIKLYLAWETSAPTLPTSSPSSSVPIDLSGKDLQLGVIQTASFVIPKGDTRYLWVMVKVAGATDIEDGRTVALETNIYWYTTVDSGNSGFIPDGKPETIRKAGFEEVTDESAEPNYLNPGDTAPVQRFRLLDHDANQAGLTIEEVKVKRAEGATATAADLAKIKVTLTYGTTNYTYTKNTLTGWDGDGLIFTKAELGLTSVSFTDEAAITVQVDIELKSDGTYPVDGHTLQNVVIITTTENTQTTTATITSPSIWTIRRAGPEEAEEISTPPAGLGINPGERLTQRVWVADRDYNGNKFQITHIWIRNLGTAETADVAGLTVWVGTTQVCSSWPSGFDLRSGGWIPVTAYTVNDEGEATITIEYRVSPLATTGRTLRPEVKVGTSEPPTTSPGTTPTYATPTLTYPEFVTIYPAGFEKVENITIDPTTVYSTQRFVAQKIKLEDKDTNTNGVTITRIRVKNIGTSADTQFVRLEVRQSGENGALLAETTNLSGFLSTGITLTPTGNNTVADDSSVEIWIWLTLAGPANTVAGRTVRLETSFSFTEGTVSGDTSSVRGTSFTIGINNPPVVQDFSWTPTNPQYGQDITFTPGTVSDPDGDAIVYSKWDFGEGADPRYVERNGPPQSATTKYPDGGTFNVTLLVRDAKGLEGSKTKQISVTLRPNQAPTVDFSWSPANPTLGQAVSFTSTVTDPDNDTPFTYSWNFGDGGTSTEANPTHTYTTAGNYTVRLEVTDRRGAKGTKEKTLTILGAPVPTVTELTANPSSPEVDQDVSFTATATATAAAPITRWRFDFGDGEVREFGNGGTTASYTITHKYAQPGAYTVQVKAQNASGWSDPKTLTIYVRPKGAVLWLNILDNPAQNQCRIQIATPPQATDLKIYILDLAGRLVLEKSVTVGTFTWDLKDQNGRDVPNGLYLVFLMAKVGDKIERTEIGRILVRR